MKTDIKNLFILPVLITGLGLTPAGRVTAQTFTTLHSFTGVNDGAGLYAGLILSGSTLYGTAQYGGSSGNGTVFAVNTDGTGFTKLHSFMEGDLNSFGYTNSDGVTPSAGLILSGNTLYGTAKEGGSSANGTVFAVNTDGTGFKNLHSFTDTPGPFYTNSDGSTPWAGLILSNNTLYGTAYYGGSSGFGAVFALNTDGTGFTNLHSFTTLSNFSNSDGAYPIAGLILSGSTLYGTANAGGSSGNGTVFAVNTDGTSFTNLHTFTATSGPDSTNSDGASSWAGLILSGKTLYGTAKYGGSSGNGTVFAVNTDGTGFTNLHSFNARHGPNSDGANPEAGLILSANTLYGTAAFGGGTVFAVNTDGTGFTILHSFKPLSNSTNNDRGTPRAGLILSGNTLFGTASRGGSAGAGAVFSLSLPPPQLTIIPDGAYVILTWPTNTPTPPAGFTLQSTTNLVSPTVWTTVSPGPVIIGGQDVVINPVSGTQKVYRLSQ